MKSFKYKDKIEKIFSHNVGDYSEQVAHNTLSFYINSTDLCFEKLLKLSTLLKTKEINIHAEEDGKCHGHEPGEYCYCFGDGRIELYCSGIKY